MSEMGPLGLIHQTNIRAASRHAVLQGGGLNPKFSPCCFRPRLPTHGKQVPKRVSNARCLSSTKAQLGVQWNTTQTRSWKMEGRLFHLWIYCPDGR